MAQSMTTMLGDFDIAQLWYHGSASVLFFMAATVICHICLLNLLIAIVSNEFDEYMLSARWSIIPHQGFVLGLRTHCMHSAIHERTTLTKTNCHGTNP